MHGRVPRSCPLPLISDRRSRAATRRQRRRFFAAAALILARGLGKRRRRTLAAAAAAVAVAMAGSRVLLDVHWLSDVVGGLALGWGWFALCAAIFGGRLLCATAAVDTAAAAAASPRPTRSQRALVGPPD